MFSLTVQRAIYLNSNLMLLIKRTLPREITHLWHCPSLGVTNNCRTNRVCFIWLQFSFYVRRVYLKLVSSHYKTMQLTMQVAHIVVNLCQKDLGKSDCHITFLRFCKMGTAALPQSLVIKIKQKKASKVVSEMQAYHEGSTDVS